MVFLSPRGTADLARDHAARCDFVWSQQRRSWRLAQAPQRGLHCGHHGVSFEQILGYVALNSGRGGSLDNRWASDFKPRTLEVPFSIKNKDGTCGQGCCPSLHPRPDLLAVYSGPQNKALLSPISLAHLSQADGPGKTLHVHLPPHTPSPMNSVPSPNLHHFLLLDWNVLLIAFWTKPNHLPVIPPSLSYT